MDYYNKYLKYKNKYLNLKNFSGGTLSTNYYIKEPIDNTFKNIVLPLKEQHNNVWKYNLPLVKYYKEKKPDIFELYDESTWKNSIIPQNAYESINKSEFLITSNSTISDIKYVRDNLTKELINDIIQHNDSVSVINPYDHETYDQFITTKWIRPEDYVLELGGNIGVVSCSINKILTDSTHHYVSEPSSIALDALYINKVTTDSHFTIIDQVISKNKYTEVSDDNKKGIAQQFVLSDESDSGYLSDQPDFFTDHHFTVLVADCEGGLISFMKENFSKMNYLELIIFEVDGVPLDHTSASYYKNVYEQLLTSNFILVDSIIFNTRGKGRINHYEVWSKVKTEASDGYVDIHDRINTIPDELNPLLTTSIELNNDLKSIKSLLPIKKYVPPFRRQGSDSTDKPLMRASTDKPLGRASTAKPLESGTDHSDRLYRRNSTGSSGSNQWLRGQSNKPQK